MSLDVLTLTQQLIQRRSVTPDDGECLALIAAALAPYGFKAEYLNAGVVKNLYLRRGDTAPLTIFLGHVDVVPSGPEAEWTSPPFEPCQRNGYLYGRGSADMKSAIAAFVVAAQQFVDLRPDHPGSLGLLLTSDEEGPSIDGVRHVMQVFAKRGEHIDYCLVGEPSSDAVLGDTIKVGRRGSLSATLTLKGKQGHIAYPHLADNPIHKMGKVLTDLTETQWDQGNADFPPTSCQFSHIQAGTGANNVIPGHLSAIFNFRYSPAVTASELQHHVTALLDAQGVDYDLQWCHSGAPFYSGQGPLLSAAMHAIQQITGLKAQCSTGGGTSDGRFVAPTGAAVIEVGCVNKSIHQIDECVKIDDLPRLSAIYLELLKTLCK